MSFSRIPYNRLSYLNLLHLLRADEGDPGLLDALRVSHDRDRLERRRRRHRRHRHRRRGRRHRPRRRRGLRGGVLHGDGEVDDLGLEELGDVDEDGEEDDGDDVLEEASATGLGTVDALAVVWEHVKEDKLVMPTKMSLVAESYVYVSLLRMMALALVAGRLVITVLLRVCLA